MKSHYLILGIYAVFAASVWIGFVGGYEKSGPQALANLGLVIAVLPVSLIDILLANTVIPGDVIDNWGRLFHAAGFPEGYVWDNGYYFFPRAILMAYLLHRWTQPKKKDDPAAVRRATSNK